MKSKSLQTDEIIVLRRKELVQMLQALFPMKGKPGYVDGKKLVEFMSHIDQIAVVLTEKQKLG